MNILIALVIVFIVLRVVFRGEIKACFERDPAARNSIEILLTYAGVHAVIAYRIAHALDAAITEAFVFSPEKK